MKMCLKVLALMLLLTGSLHAYQHSSNMAIASSSAVLRIRHVENTVFGKNHALGHLGMQISSRRSMNFHRLYDNNDEDNSASQAIPTPPLNSVENNFILKDKQTGAVIPLTREDKERIFLESIQSYYSEGKNNLSDQEFDALREDLSWEGSSLVRLNRDETKFLNAMQAYAKGKPILSDVEFDQLKQRLRESQSPIAAGNEPRCFIDTGLCKATWNPDNIRTSSLYLPATLFFTVLSLGFLYEIPFVRSIFNPIILLSLVAYPIYIAATKVTNGFLFKDPFVATGPCPNCGVENRVFFGDIFNLPGDHDESKVKCTNCKSELQVIRKTLRVTTTIKKESDLTGGIGNKKPAMAASASVGGADE